MRGRRAVVAALGFLVLAGLVGAACSRGSSSSSGGGSALGPAKVDPNAQASPGVAERAGSGGVAGGPVAAPAGALPEIGARVVKTAGLTLQVKDGTFDDRFQQATLVAGRHGGYVASSDTAQGKLRSGTVVIRVPASEFESALGELKALGTVRQERLSGQDVTSQFVDLEARVRNWEAQESVLLGLMAQATNVSDSIRVQNQLQDVQLQIEELKGQLRVLSDQADLSTITLSMSERGFVAPRPESGTSIAAAWHRAVRGFVAVLAAVVVGLGYLVPIGALLLLAAVGLRLAWPRVRPEAGES
jgi:hypothetical protein